MSYAGNFNRAVYQKRIDDIIGTKDDRPLIKLAWAPEEFRWYPYRMGEDPPGYTFPIFCNGRDADGKLTAPKRWVLLERVEPEQFAPGWEAARYAVVENKSGKKEVWDIKGPCPSERYIELRCHSYHDGKCCPCIGDACECGEQYDHCWGEYAEPNDRLLDWIRMRYHQSVNDPDVQPTQDARFFEAPNAQRELKNRVLTDKEKEDAEMEKFDQEMRDVWLKQRHSILVNGFKDNLKRTESGIILLN